MSISTLHKGDDDDDDDNNKDNVYIVCTLLGISPTSDCSLPTFRNPLSVPSSRAGCRVLHTLHTLHLALEDGTDRGFRNVGKLNRTPGKYPKEYIQYSKHGESLKSRINASLFATAVSVLVALSTLL